MNSTADIRKKKINEFFLAYQQLYTDALASDKPDTKATARVFADCFLAAGPWGVNCGQNGKAFTEKLEKGYAFYRSIGTESMHILFNDITLLDEYHAMANVQWHAGLVKKDLQELTIDFHVIYLLQTLNDKIKIFGYIAEDEEKILKEHGIEPYR
jgi:hypothetical protein